MSARPSEPDRPTTDAAVAGSARRGGRTASDKDDTGPRCQVCARPGLQRRKNGAVWNHGNKVRRGHSKWRQSCGGSGLLPAVLATPETFREHGKPNVTIWHKPTEPEKCTGDCDWHGIACHPTDGISSPGGNQYIPLDLNKLNERWCPDCRALFDIPPGEPTAAPVLTTTEGEEAA